MLDAILYVLWLILIVCLVFFGLCVLLIFAVVVALVVRGVMEYRKRKCLCEAVGGSNSHSNAEDEELPFSDFEEQE